MHSPRSSQKLVYWCVDYALNILIDYISDKIDPLKDKQLTKLFNQKLQDKGISKREISRMTYKLKRQKYIEIVKGGSVVLTDKAKIRAIDKYATLTPQDEKRRLVSFDIPEAFKKQRNSFRRTIKRMGFRQIQKSLWVCDRNVGDLVEIAAEENQVGEYVAYFVIEKSNIDKHIEKLLQPRIVPD